MINEIRASRFEQEFEWHIEGLIEKWVYLDRYTFRSRSNVTQAIKQEIEARELHSIYGKAEKVPESVYWEVSFIFLAFQYKRRAQRFSSDFRCKNWFDEEEPARNLSELASKLSEMFVPYARNNKELAAQWAFFCMLNNLELNDVLKLLRSSHWNDPYYFNVQKAKAFAMVREFYWCNREEIRSRILQDTTKLIDITINPVTDPDSAIREFLEETDSSIQREKNR